MTMEFLRNAELWVAVGVLLFAALIIRLKVPTAATAALDGRGAKIQAALDEAERLRDEARALLESLKLRRAEAEVQAAQMMREAEDAARRFEAEAHAKLEEQIVRRTQLADRRIAAAEAQAAAEVKAAAAQLAADAAGSILATRLASQTIDPLVASAIAQIGSRLN